MTSVHENQDSQKMLISLNFLLGKSCLLLKDRDCKLSVVSEVSRIQNLRGGFIHNLILYIRTIYFDFNYAIF